jgi:hypothetical protein
MAAAYPFVQRYLWVKGRACPWVNAGGYFGKLDKKWRQDFPVTVCIGQNIMWYGYQNIGVGS